MAKLLINYVNDAEQVIDIAVESGAIGTMTDAQALAVAEALAVDPVLGPGFEAQNVRVDSLYIRDLSRAVDVPRGGA